MNEASFSALIDVMIDGRQHGTDDDEEASVGTSLASMISKSSKSFSGDLCLGMHGTSEPAHAKSTEMTNLY
jgi:hypothetical protein